MDSSGIQARVSAFITHEFLVDFSNEVNAETDLFEEELIDSFGFIELVSFIEAEFQVKISDDDMASPDIGSLAGIVRLIEARMADMAVTDDQALTG
ncbi:MAG: acyl carrier protein [Pseudomonadota bacterium]